jgi:glycosyltransferase involved in cell wall biosynthesis
MIIQKSRLFEEDFYIKNHPEAINDPIIHYIEEGWSKGLNPSERFNTNYYLENNRDVRESGTNPFIHYILHGQYEGRNEVQELWTSVVNKRLNLDSIARIPCVDSGVIFVSHDATETGAPLVLLELCRQYKNIYNDSMVIVLMAGGNLEKDFEALATVINLDMELFSKNIVVNPDAEILFSLLAEKGYTQCIANTVVSGFLNDVFEDNCIQTTHLIHEMLELIEEYKFTQAAMQIGKSSSSVIFSSKFAAEKFAAQFMNKKAFHVIPQGISENMICNDKEKARRKILETIGCLNSDSKIVLGAGLAQYRKGTDLFLSTAHECYLKGHIDNLHFVWLGNREVEYEDWQNTILPTLPYKEHIHFVDFVEDPTDFFGGSDIFLLTSREDPLPTVALIALKNELPVIMFENTGGIQEYIDDLNGAVIEQFNTAQMAGSIFKVLNSKRSGNLSKKIYTNAEYFSKIMSLSQSEQLKISVIIPNYNYEQYIEQRIDSILKQTYHPDEIIFLDDCSTDNSVAIAENKLREFGIPYRIILNDENAGVYKQWLKGIQLARNELIWIAEADDFSDPNFLKSLVSYFNRDDNLGLAYAQSKIVDESGNVVSEDVRFHTDSIDQEKWKKSYISKGIREIEHALLYRNTIPNVSACLFNKKYLEGIDEILLRYKYCGDWYLYSYLFTKSNVAFCKRSLNYFRKHSNNVTTINTHKSAYIKEVLDIKRHLMSLLKISRSQYHAMLELFEKDFLKGNPNEDNIKAEISEELRNLESKTAKHIVFVTFNGEFGGSEVLWFEAAKHISQKQCKVSVLCKSYLLNEEKKGELDDCNVDLFEQSVLDIERFQKLMPDYVIFSIGDHNDGGEFFTFCKQNNIEYVIVNQLVKEDMWTTDNEQLNQIFGGYASAAATFFTCKNNIDIFERKMNSQLNNAQIHFNPISIDRDDYVPYPNIDDTYYLAFPARLLTIHKGQDILIRVLARSKWRERNLQVNFYGEGPDYEKLVRLVNELNLASIKFHGFINNIRTIWESNHAFILTSHMEGIPIVLLGATFAGRASIVTDVGGNSEVIGDNLTGFIAKTPTEEAIDEALERAWTRREEWKRMGELARESILSHYPEKPLEDFEIKLEKVFKW